MIDPETGQKKEPKTDFPVGLEMNMRAFRKYKSSWIGIWRALGSFDANGSFVAPVSFMEAKQMPKSELDIYMELDHLISIRQRQLSDQQ